MALGEYIVTARADLASDAAGRMFIDNASENDCQAKIKTFVLGSETLTDIDCTKNVTVDSNGTSKTPQNTEIGSSNTSEIEISTGGSYSGGTTFFSGVIYPNTRGAVAGTLSSEHEDLIITPGTNLLIEATNKGSSTSRVTLELTFSEYHY